MNNSINYQFLNSYYRCLFEGVDNPIYYQDLYPTHLFNDETKKEICTDFGEDYYEKLLERFHYIQGLKYKIGQLFLEGKEKKKNLSKLKNYNKHREQYIDTLLKFFTRVIQSNPFVNYGVLAVPSSTINFKNMITKLVEDVIGNSTFSGNIIDLTENLYRARPKAVAHEGSTRSRESNISTLGLRNKEKFNGIEVLIILDDVTTSGNTFGAINDFLVEQNIKLPVINFALGRSMDARSQYFYDEWNSNISATGQNNKAFGDIQKITGIIYDLDQTLVDTHKKDEEFETQVKDHSRPTEEVNSSLDSRESYTSFLQRNDNVYHCYSGVKELQEKSLPFAIVSNSSEKRCQYLMQLGPLQSEIYPSIWLSHSKQNQTTQIRNQYSKYYGFNYDNYQSSSRYTYKDLQNIIGYSKALPAKPSPARVEKALNWLGQTFTQNSQQVVGVGNTPEDMIAYHKAGIKAILALWGVPSYLKDFAKKYWNADYYFDSVTELNAWIEKNSIENEQSIFPDSANTISQNNINEGQSSTDPFLSMFDTDFNEFSNNTEQEISAEPTTNVNNFVVMGDLDKSEVSEAGEASQTKILDTEIDNLLLNNLPNMFRKLTESYSTKWTENKLTVNDDWIEAWNIFIEDHEKLGFTGADPFNERITEIFDADKYIRKNNIWNKNPVDESIKVTNDDSCPKELGKTEIQYINLYAAFLINNIRNQMDLPSFSVTKGSIRVAHEFKKYYEDNNWNISINKTLDPDANQEIGKIWGSDDLSIDEMVYYQKLKNINLSLDDLKFYIYEGVKALLLNHDLANYQTTKKLLQSEDKIMGVDVSFELSDTQDEFYIVIHFAFMDNKKNESAKIMQNSYNIPIHLLQDFEKLDRFWGVRNSLRSLKENLADIEGDLSLYMEKLNSR